MRHRSQNKKADSLAATMEIDPLPPISGVNAPTPDTEKVVHVIPDALMAPGGGAEWVVADATDPRWESVINRNVKCAVVDDIAFTYVKQGFQSDETI